uniref:Uncharacterized protein n=1 Tax=Physcomitrium patens TaxID=3218 RepID=A0A2K1JLU3_PHYPA|nr:hypothetical protein PHYPA_017345 [Physcomitrium patens]
MGWFATAASASTTAGLTHGLAGASFGSATRGAAAAAFGKVSGCSFLLRRKCIAGAFLLELFRLHQPIQGGQQHPFVDCVYFFVVVRL